MAYLGALAWSKIQRAEPSRLNISSWICCFLSYPQEAASPPCHQQTSAFTIASSEPPKAVQVGYRGAEGPGSSSRQPLTTPGHPFPQIGNKSRSRRYRCALSPIPALWGSGDGGVTATETWILLT